MLPLPAPSTGLRSPIICMASRGSPHRALFNYNTAESNLVGEVLRAAIGMNAGPYLSQKIWQPMGMAFDANWLLSSPYGRETGGCCISATLRDYARLGLFALADGVLPDGTRVLPEGWIAASTSPSQGYEGYGYKWWLYGEGRYGARGVFGQAIFIDPASKLVVAAHSNGQVASKKRPQPGVDAALIAVSVFSSPLARTRLLAMGLLVARLIDQGVSAIKR